MERRVFIKRTAVGLASVAVTGTSALAADKEKAKSRFNAKTNMVSFGSKKLKVSDDQKAAYLALPEELQAKLNPPKGGKLPTAAELQKIGKSEITALSTTSTKRYSTVMCPW